MKQLLSLLLLVILSLSKSLDAQAQVYIKLPDGLVNEMRMKSYVDSAILANKTGSVVPVVSSPPTPTKIDTCEAGPEIRSIFDITPTSLAVQFHGKNIKGIDYKVFNSAGQLVSFGAVKPSSNVLFIKYTSQNSGKFTLKLDGNTCTGHSQKSFEIRKSESEVIPPKPAEGNKNYDNYKYELILNTTGRGFDGNSATGLEKDFPAYIDQFKFGWGWGISGVRVCVRWYDWEPSEGDYKVQGLKNLIEFCRSRNLDLDLCFWPILKAKDSRITSPFIMSNGKTFYSVDIGGMPEFSEASNNYVDAVSNARIKKAVTELSKVFYTYEKAGSISMGGGSSEELVFPYRDDQISDFSPSNIKGFHDWLRSRNITPASPPVWPGKPAFVVHNSLIGKEWVRYNTYALRQYFDNFVDAVHAGSEKGKAVYFTAAVGGPATQWTQDAYLSYIAANADEFYHSDGTQLENVERKTTGLNLGIGSLDIPSSVEFDQEDLGDITGGGFKGDLLYGFAMEAYNRGGHRVHLAMYFDRAKTNNMESSLKKLMAEKVGQKWIKPILTSQNTQTVNIENFIWNGGWLNVSKDFYYKGIAPDFWGEVQP